MGKWVDFYFLDIRTKGGRSTKHSAGALLREIERLARVDMRAIQRNVEGKPIEIASYTQSDSHKNRFVVPFCKKKGENPYKMNEETRQLEAVDGTLFDVNYLYYDGDHDVALLTTSREGPNSRLIAKYLSSFFEEEDELAVHLVPALDIASLEPLRASDQAKELRVELDLGQDVGEMFRNQIVEEGRSIVAGAQQAAFGAKDANSKVFTFTLGMERSKKETIDKDILLNLLATLDIDSNLFKSVVVRYKDKRFERVKRLQLKGKPIVLRADINTEGMRQVTADMLISQAEKVVLTYTSSFRDQRDQLFSERVEVGEYALNTTNFEVA